MPVASRSLENSSVKLQNAPAGKRRIFPVRRVVGPLLLYILIALGLLTPYRTNALRPCGDLPVVMSLTLQADHALRQGQFPIRIGPECHGGMGFPVFQFYGNLPYTVTGAFSILFHNPYTGWKIGVLICLVCAGYFTMRLGAWLSGSDRAAVVAGAVFLCAPYLMTDLNARGAFAEMAAFCLLPAAFYATLRCLESVQWRRILWCAMGWTLIGLTHNITYLYGVLFTALFCLPFVLSRRGPARVLRLAIAGVLHAAMMVWYVLPQFRMVNLLVIKERSFDPFTLSALTPLHILLAPVLTNTLEGISTPNLGLQVGWPILGGVLLAIIGFILPRRTAAPRRLIIAMLMGVFVVSFFLAWSPFDFWKHLPKTLWFIQFPYRMLVFVVLFGCGLMACGLARLFPRRVPVWAMLVVLAGTGWALASYVPRGAPEWTDFVPYLYEHPQIDGMTEYLITPRALAATNVSDADPENIDWEVRTAQIQDRPAKGPVPRVALPKSLVRYGARTHIDYFAKSRTWLEMPVLDYPGLLDVRDNGHRVQYYNAGRFVTLRLGRGLHKVVIRFVGVKWANVVSLIAWIGVLALLLFPMLQAAADRTGSALVLIASAKYPGLAPREAVLGFIVLLVAAVIPLYSPLWRWLKLEPSMQLTASASSSPPENAFDEDETTAWIAAGGGQATLVVQMDRPIVLHGFVLEPRVTSLNECWQHVFVRLLNGGQAMYNDSFDFPGAANDPAETINFPPVAADRLELVFSQPVLTLHNGGHVTADQVNPGYREIHILRGR